MDIKSNIKECIKKGIKTYKKMYLTCINGDDD